MKKNINAKCVRASSGLLALFVVAACNSTDPTLGVEQPETTATPTSGAVTTTSPATPLAEQDIIGRIHFAPIVGAPVDAVTALSNRLSVSAPTNKIKLKNANSPNTDHEIRGYFSALAEGGAITVIHVWDIFTLQGQRVHRIQGQEKFAGAAADPWRAVPNRVMESIADKVLAEYASWRGSSTTVAAASSQ